MSLRVLATGPLTLVQDLGRPGLAALGVSPSGAADRGAHALANRLVGNPESSASLEVLAGGLVLEASEATVMAVTGAPVPITVGGIAAPVAAPVYVAAGQRVELGRPETGLRSYVALLGGVAAEPVLGSRSFDTIARLGPAPLAGGDVVPVGRGPLSGDDGILSALSVGAAADVAAAAFRVGGARVPGGPVEVRMSATWGPRADWFTPGARAALASARWEVSPESDRVGVRCTGAVLERRRTGELPSEPLVRGSVQVPPSGQPVLFLADHPTTGGYPVIAVLDAPSVDLLGQVRAGDGLRLAVRSVSYPTDLEAP